MVRGKKGFMRVVEATIAIILVLGSLIILTSRHDFREQTDLSEILPPILNEIARDDIFRDKIVKGEADLEDLEKFIGERIGNPSLEFEVKVCELNDLCSLSELPDNLEEIYAAERVIGASVSYVKFSPKKVKIFVWRG